MRKRRVSEIRPLPVIGLLGAGRMGRGIAHAFAYAGHEVRLIDVKRRAKVDAERIGRQALAEVRASLAALAQVKAFPARAVPAIMKRVRFVARDPAPEALAKADVLFEGVPEVMDIKREALALACAHLRADALIASTTSTFLVDDMAKLVTRPERFLNAHWLNPAYLIPLVEVCPHAGTDSALVRRFTGLLENIGKVPVLCRPAPGYIVPRFQVLVMNEAARMVQSGIATPEDIDRAVRYGFGFRYANMGVVEFIDYGGVDILHYAANYLADNLDERYRPPEIIDRYMREGRRGLREGKGFFDWSRIDVPAYRKQALAKMVKMLRYAELLRPPGSAKGRRGRRGRG
ncbi:MAG: 3-hydroxybutyryl-CoA dehydrogenase [Betaproteobacteria bacterium RIFCSPLOWO2_02_FULL_64_12]|nr:MAG: 3-hydroxybutyryl-CoA dehydrogenase [Betaproteobacteria bacterium RIFCSPLOWO2_02_FULL_64_12]